MDIITFLIHFLYVGGTFFGGFVLGILLAPKFNKHIKSNDSANK